MHEFKQNFTKIMEQYSMNLKIKFQMLISFNIKRNLFQKIKVNLLIHRMYT
jgi:hypothetical protein